MSSAAIAVSFGCSESASTPGGSHDAAAGASGATGDAATPAHPDAGSPADQRSTVVLPAGEPGIGFDDLQWSTALDRLIIPAGRAGYVGLLDPRTEQVERLGMLSSSDTHRGGHSFGATSAIEAEGLVYAIDRTTLELVQLDPASGDTLEVASLGASPDYVRFVPATRELWVTEPTGMRFEIFALGEGSPPSLSPAGELALSGGPESLVVAADGRTAYTNTFAGETMRIDATARVVEATFENGCVISLGLAVDDDEGLFVACGEGKAASVDAAGGLVRSTLAAGAGLDTIAYSNERRHLYLNGSSAGELTIAGVAPDGTLSELATVTTAASEGSSCVASDPYGNAWVCDGSAGQLIRIADIY